MFSKFIHSTVKLFRQYSRPVLILSTGLLMLFVPSGAPIFAASPPQRHIQLDTPNGQPLVLEVDYQTNGSLRPMQTTLPGDEDAVVVCADAWQPESPYPSAASRIVTSVRYDVAEPPDGEKPGMLYVDDYGWFDNQHWDVGDPKKVLEDVENAVKNGGGIVQIQHGVKYGFQIRVTYEVSGETPIAQAHATALGMYLDFGYRFESWEGIMPIIGWGTSFSVEDQPTHYLSMAAAILGLTQCEVMSLLGPVRATTYEPPGSLFPTAEVKNYGITPRVLDKDGNWVNVPWPPVVALDAATADTNYWRPIYWQMDIAPGELEVWWPPALQRPQP